MNPCFGKLFPLVWVGSRHKRVAAATCYLSSTVRDSGEGMILFGDETNHQADIFHFINEHSVKCQLIMPIYLYAEFNKKYGTDFKFELKK